MVIAKKVFWNCGLDLTTIGTENRASMFIKATFGFPDILKII